jgi:hypothetical protein
MRIRQLSLGLACVAVTACGPSTVPSASPLGSAQGSGSLTASAAPSPSMAALASADPQPVGAYRWTQASVPVEPHTWQTDVAATSFGDVAIGVQLNTTPIDPSTTFAPGTNPLANFYIGAVWTSSDGGSWSRVADQPAFKAVRLEHVIATDDGVAIFANAGACLPDACGGLPPNGGTVVIESSDGQAWQRVEISGLADGAVNDVVRTASGYLAAGFEASADGTPQPGQENTQPAVWRSADARHWTQVTHLPAGELRIARLWADGDRVIAVAATDTELAVWTSADGGATWTASHTTLPNQCCTSFAILNGTVVDAQQVDRVGEKINGQVATSDGGQWTIDTPKWLAGVDPEWVQVIGGSVVVFGWKVHRDADGLVVSSKEVVEASSDGTTWAPLAVPSGWDGQMPIAVAVRGKDLVALLGPLDRPDSSPAQPVTTLWLGTAGG